MMEGQQLFRQGRAGKGIPGRRSHAGVLSSEKQLLGLWGYRYLGTVGVKLGVLGYKW